MEKYLTTYNGDNITGIEQRGKEITFMTLAYSATITTVSLSPALIKYFWQASWERIIPGGMIPEML